jgi:hypothetical protein
VGCRLYVGLERAEGDREAMRSLFPRKGVEQNMLYTYHYYSANAATN